MMHNKRTFSVSNVETAEELADTLTRYSLCLCSGYRLGGLLFLNDSYNEDSAVEMAVVDEARMVQIESVTFGWMDKAEAIEQIEEMLADTETLVIGRVKNKVENCDGHTCRLCA